MRRLTRPGCRPAFLPEGHRIPAERAQAIVRLPTRVGRPFASNQLTSRGRERKMKLSGFETILAATSVGLFLVIILWGIEILHRI
jgi:hypothetical protein